MPVPLLDCLVAEDVGPELESPQRKTLSNFIWESVTPAMLPYVSFQDKAIKRFQVRNMETWLEYSTPLHVCAVSGKGRCDDVQKLQMCLRSKKIVS